MPRNPRGFTLLELLVAVAILAVIGIASYRLLDSTIATRDTAARHDATLLALQKAMQILQRDIEQAASRPVRDEFGDAQPALYIPQENVLELTRLGWRNPLGEPRAELVRVRYIVEDGRLRRYYWNVLDRAQDSKPQYVTLLENVEDFRVSVLNPQGTWTSAWPSLDQARADRAQLPMPGAVDISFTVPPFGELRRLFRVPENGHASGR